MDAYLILSQAVAVLQVLRKRVDSRLSLLEDCDHMEKEKRIETQNKLFSYKEDIVYCLKYVEGIVSELREEL